LKHRGDGDKPRERLAGFRAIIGAAPLKLFFVSGRGRRDRSFRAIIGAAPLKRPSPFRMAYTKTPRFRAIIGAAPLKHAAASQLQYGGSMFPRHHWRGSIEATKTA